MNVKEHIFLLLLQNVIYKWFKYSYMLMKLCCMQLACDSLMLQTETKEKVCLLQHRWLHALWVMTIEGQTNFYIETGLLSVLNLHYEHQFPHLSFDKVFVHQYILISLEFHSILWSSCIFMYVEMLGAIVSYWSSC